jgi:hypothetical protein
MLQDNIKGAVDIIQQSDNLQRTRRSAYGSKLGKIAEENSSAIEGLARHHLFIAKAVNEFPAKIGCNFRLEIIKKIQSRTSESSVLKGHRPSVAPQLIPVKNKFSKKRK